MKTTTKINHLLGAVRSVFVTLGLTQNPTALARILIIGLAALTAMPSEAAPNSGGGTGGGVIYYLGPFSPGPDITLATTTMNSDGSDKRLLVIGGWYGIWGNPSRALHDNHRWFLKSYKITGQFYPDGSQRREIFARRDDQLTPVQLTDDPTLQTDGRVDWVPGGDQQISFRARRWSSTEPDATVVEGGLYMASLVYDGAGNITGLAEQPITPAIPFPLAEASPGDLWPGFLEYCWGPAGDQIAYNNFAVNELWLADLLNVHTRIYIGTAQAPDWSPDGSKIAFTHGGIATIKPNGTGFKWIIPGTSTWIYDAAHWSPGGSHIIYTGFSNGNFDVFRATATGGSRVNLTSTPSLHEKLSSAGWR